MAEVRIRVGASVDQSMRLAFRPLVAAAIEARRQILGQFAQVPREIVAAMAGVSRAQGGAFKGATAEARAAYSEQVRIARAAAAQQKAEAREAEKMAAALERSRVAAVRRTEQEIRREHTRTAREREIAARRALAAERAAMNRHAQTARSLSYHSARFFTPHVPITSLARRAGSEIVRGFGVDPTFSGSMQRNIALESRATTLTNQARMSGTDIEASRVQGRVREVAGRLGISRESTMGALEQVQALTGDLPLALDLLDKLGERSIVSGAKIDDFAGMVGNVVNQMEGVTDKGAAAIRVADAFAAQGARGAVEVRGMARYMALVAPQATKFAGSPEENMKMLGAFVQLGRETGGATSEAEATRGVARFATTFRTPARLRAFEKITGKSAFADEGRTILRNPMELIKDALVGSGGNQEKFGQIFMNILGARPADALLGTFNRAGRGDAGLAAVDEKFGRFMRDLELSPELVAKNLAAHDAKTETQAQQFQVEFDLIIEEMAGRLLPVLKEASPAILDFVKSVTDLIAWAVQNPGKAITAAIVTSIARAGLEGGARLVIEKVFLRSVGFLASLFGGGGVGGAGRVGGGPAIGGAARAAGMVGLVGGAVGIGLAGAAALTAGTLSSHREASGAIDRGGALTNKLETLVMEGKPITAEEKDRLSRQVTEKQMELDRMHALASMTGGDVLHDIWSGNFGRAADAITTGAGRTLGLSSFDEKYGSLAEQLQRDRTALANIETIKEKPEDQLRRYVAKNPETTESDMKAALARGGIAELEKIATLASKQQTVEEKLLAKQTEATGWLEKIHDKLGPDGDGAPGADHDET